MKSYKIFITTLFIVITHYGFLCQSVAQEIGGEELPALGCYSLDYDAEGERKSVSVSIYPAGYLASGDNHEPQLSNGKVTPEYGDFSTQFFYEVYYQDSAEYAPVEIYVYVDETASYMALESGLAYDGVYKSAGILLDSGIHNYYFTATDEEGGYIRLPAEGSIAGPTINDPPQISNGKVDPESGDSSTDFFYYVDYYDKEGDIPENRYVYIDNIAYEMDLYSGEVYNGTYRYGPKLLKVGNHNFHFSFTDGDGNTFRLPVEGSIAGPTINDPPQLSNGRVDPDSGGGSTDFYYYVDYYDKEGNSPETAHVNINNVPYVMDLYSGKSSNGTYRYGPKLLKAGKHDFYFSFTDEYGGIVRMPTEGNYSGPEIAAGSIYIYDSAGDADIILDDSATGYTTPFTLSPVAIGIHKVALLKSDYVSFPSYAMVKVVEDQTVDTPFILLPCPAMIALKNDSENLHLLRGFRDNLLNQTSSGTEYVNLYYTHALEMSLFIMNDSAFKIRMEKILHLFIPILDSLMRKERPILTFEMKEEIELLLDALREKGSPFLKSAIKRIRSDLKKGELPKSLGFEIEGDN